MLLLIIVTYIISFNFFFKFIFFLIYFFFNLYILEQIDNNGYICSRTGHIQHIHADQFIQVSTHTQQIQVNSCVNSREFANIDQVRKLKCAFFFHNQSGEEKE